MSKKRDPIIAVLTFFETAELTAANLGLSMAKEIVRRRTANAPAASAAARKAATPAAPKKAKPGAAAKKPAASKPAVEQPALN